MGQEIDIANPNSVVTSREHMDKIIKYCEGQVQPKCEVSHSFSKGLYMRELYMPKDSLIVGKVHRDKTMNILVSGSMMLNDGTNVYEVSAPYMFESEAMTRRMLYTYTDCVWICVHPTNETDLVKLEEEFIASEEEVRQCLGS